MTNQEMKLLHERMKKEDPKLLVLMEKCFDAGVLSGKEPAQRTWVGLTDEDKAEIKKQANYNWETTTGEYASKVQALTEAKLKAKNSL